MQTTILVFKEMEREIGLKFYSPIMRRNVMCTLRRIIQR
jgi:hypothetical protein